MFARCWLHNGMLTFGGRKMSKSLGNTLVLHELLERYPAEAAALHAAEGALPPAAGLVRRDAGAGAAHAGRPVRHLARSGRGRVGIAGSHAARRTDRRRSPTTSTRPRRWRCSRGLRTMRANPQVQPDDKKAAKAALLGAGAFLGLLQQDPEAWFKRQGVGEASIPNGSSACSPNAPMRASAGTSPSSDRIRDELAARGVIIEDGPQGARWKIASPPGPSTMNARPDGPQVDRGCPRHADAAGRDRRGIFVLQRLDRALPVPDRSRPQAAAVSAGAARRKRTRCRAASRRSGSSPRATASGLQFRAISDSAIVSGLIALLLRVYSGRSAQEILATEPRFVETIGLAKHLSPTRSNGLAAMLGSHVRRKPGLFV